ncbi:hypothetical protein [Absidia glauca]|uniref:Uncharacterized protein n=1 Tax=Absidia glauca TaxID=4829 RepID=A0A163K4A9_ABSGL|nr:hypothetical protein [Absidia glauca]
MRQTTLHVTGGTLTAQIDPPAASIKPILSVDNTTVSSSPPAVLLRRARRRQSYRKEAYDKHKDTLLIPPFSPTYCQPNCFSYSNFYIKLPDDRWMIRFRDGNRGILRTDFINGSMI